MYQNYIYRHLRLAVQSLLWLWETITGFRVLFTHLSRPERQAASVLVYDVLFTPDLSLGSSSIFIAL